MPTATPPLDAVARNPFVWLSTSEIQPHHLAAAVVDTAHRLTGTLCPDMKSTLERPGPDVVTAVTRSADLLREGRGLLPDLVDRAEVRDAGRGPDG